MNDTLAPWRWLVCSELHTLEIGVWVAVNVFKGFEKKPKQATGPVIYRRVNPLKFALQQGRTVGLTTNTMLVRRDGLESAIEDSAAPIRNREGVAVGAVIVFRDVGEAHALAGKMAYVAQHDILTELPNRLLLNDRLIQSMGIMSILLEA